ncbi:MAG: hypothetical protein V5A44_01800 [Haloarculaceae archaeon]
MTDRPGGGRLRAGGRRAARATLRAGLRLGPWPLLVALAGTASAHSGSLGGATASATVPTWLTVLTGGVVVGATFLFTTLLTDHDAMRDVNWWRVAVPTPPSVRRALVWVGRAVSVGLLALVLVTGLAGTTIPTQNFALLLIWAGWWAGYTMTTYLLGNTWPALNPFRAVATVLRRGLAAVSAPTGAVEGPGTDGTVENADRGGSDRSTDGGVTTVGQRALTTRTVPESWGVWPAVVGLVAMVYVEVVSPIGSDPRALGLTVGAYAFLTVAGALVYGESWFDRVDPVSRVFATYGRIAPIQRDADGFSLRLPGTAATEDVLPDRPGETEFVVALLWVTTYDGLVSTPLWARLLTPIAEAGVPAVLVYVLVLLAGFGVFLGVYRLASRRIRERADTYVAVDEIGRWFAPALVPIAAGYHVAHFLGYFLTLSPALAAVAAAPFAPPNTVALVLPDWFGSVKLGFVLLGHVLAVWVAHSLSFELFPGVLAAIRSQVPSVIVMVFYTMVSLWVITQPYVSPPFV